MAPTVEVHVLAFNEAELMPYVLRHYRTFADRIVIHDAGSTDGTQGIAKTGGAEVVPWETGGEFNDQLAMELKNTCWHGTLADWVIVCDCDELWYFPDGAQRQLMAYFDQQIAVVKPQGFNMVSEVYPTTTGQIYDEVKTGSPEPWYAKCALFSPRLVREMHYLPGAHDCKALLYSGEWIDLPMGSPSSVPPSYLLHYHHLGPVERLARLNDEKRARLAPIHKVCGWGNFEDGLKHAQDIRAKINANLLQVIP